MTPQDLIAAFDSLAEAPDGVARLRELVLQLAVRGKLVPQQSDEPPVVVDRGAERKLKRESRWHPEWVDEEPPGWVRCSMACLGRWGSGGTPRRGNPAFYGGDIPWLKIGDLNDGMVTSSEICITQAGLDGSSAKMVPIDAVFLAMYGSIGKTGIAGIECCTNQAIAHCVPHADVISTSYLYRLILALRQELLDQGKGGAQQNISQTVIKHLDVLLPPLAEQHRIVARVDELMGLLDRLEAARTARDTTRAAARDAALAALREADTPEEVEVAWNRLAERMDDLLCDPADINPLRQAVLQLAVRGKLVPQDAGDEPASVLLERLRTTREALLAEDARTNRESASIQRKLAKLAKAGPPESPYRLPPGWSVTYLLDASERVVDCHNKTAPYVESGIPIVRTSNVRFGEIVFTGMKYIDEPTYAYWSHRCPPRPGDLIFTREAPMGQVALIPPDLKVCLGQRTMLVRPMEHFVSARYLLLCLMEPGVVERAVHTSVGATVKHLRVGDVERLPILVPPRAEQDRIVERVEGLLQLLVLLEERTDSTTALHTSFAHSAVHHLDA